MTDWRTDLGPLASLVSESTRDLCVDGNGRVWVDNGIGFENTRAVLSPDIVRRIGVAVIDGGGGRVDDARPIGDAALAGDIRAHLVLPPIARSGPLLSLRFPRRDTVTLDRFEAASGVNLEERARQGTLIAGITGSGKTTLATALVDTLPDTRRVVIIEDLAEMRPTHPHTVHLNTRAPNADGGGSVSLAELVRESLRMRPDTIVVGELRGREIKDFLAAATTGHSTIATIHAASLEQVAVRVMTLALLAGLPRDAIAEVVESAVPSVTFCHRTRHGVSVTSGRLVADKSRLRVEVP